MKAALAIIGLNTGRSEEPETMASKNLNDQGTDPGSFPDFSLDMNDVSMFPCDQGFLSASNGLQSTQPLPDGGFDLDFDQLQAYFNADTTIPTGTGTQNLEFFYPQATAPELTTKVPESSAARRGLTGDVHGLEASASDDPYTDISFCPKPSAHIGHDVDAGHEMHPIEVVGDLPQIEPEGFVEEPLCRVKTFYVGGTWPIGSNPATAQQRVGQMYVEQIDPEKITKDQAIIFIHGDFHHGKVSMTISLGRCFSANNSCFRSSRPSQMETQVGHRSSFGRVIRSLWWTCLPLEDPTFLFPFISSALRLTRSPKL